MKKDILKDLLAKPGRQYSVSDFDLSFIGELSKQDAKGQLTKNVEKLSELQSMLYAQNRYSYYFSGYGRSRKRRDNQTRHVRYQSARMPSIFVQATFCRGIGPRLSLAYQSLPARKRENRNFQPFSL